MIPAKLNSLLMAAVFTTGFAIGHQVGTGRGAKDKVQELTKSAVAGAEQTVATAAAAKANAAEAAKDQRRTRSYEERVEIRIAQDSDPGRNCLDPDELQLFNEPADWSTSLRPSGGR